ncbi:hypothetical protein [Vallitalea guaymasensis]|uniref:hypothetical protein n=1 Tax=Vallitalea guaymasensis TaxID=1185412 RepID=UPI000DE49C71|nr:hypothetical protein [Vallitalea guaymasensis]
MYCRNCGAELSGKTSLCSKCGSHPYKGNSYCQNCGVMTSEKQELCIKCGVRLVGTVSNSVSTKNNTYSKIYKIVYIIANFISLIGAGAIIYNFISINNSHFISDHIVGLGNSIILVIVMQLIAYSMKKGVKRTKN